MAMIGFALFFGALGYLMIRLGVSPLPSGTIPLTVRHTRYGGS